MRCHRLSLQKPKRNQKVSLSDAYPLINNFYDYIRRASQWAPSCGPMGASLPRDVCNIDESPLSYISNKRFATVILTIFGSDNTRVGPVLIFKGKGQASSIEKLQYANGVKVYFTLKAVNNRITMDNKIFRELGYTWADHVTPIKLHTLPGYMYDPSDRNLTCSIEEN
ncbi:unnamed protein product [Rotaria socialis]|uniref:Uncharacterized protein n=1 Tax=Rotaria socialis TaxID=392032 RepID=A0A821CX15_9BILA|nr:unnamed protein product [Rotaria socialis]